MFIKCKEKVSTKNCLNILIKMQTSNQTFPKIYSNLAQRKDRQG